MTRDGSTVVGKWENDQLNGHGTYTSSSGLTSYEGEWKNSQFHGEGCLKSADGSSYNGEWEMGKKHGIGAEHFPNDSRYIGCYENGSIGGYGLLFLADSFTLIVKEWNESEVMNKVRFARKSEKSGVLKKLLEAVE